MAEFQQQIYKFNNGLTLLTDHIPGSFTLAIRVLVKFGSRFENEENKGIAHFLEHMLFKGTNNRTAKQIVEEIDNMGGDINAYTSKENTVYVLTILNEFIEEGLEVLADMICNSNFPLEEIEKEREVIIQEVYECIDDPEEYLFDSFFEENFKNHAMGHNILGTLETLSKISREKLIEWKNKFYNPENIIISIAGDFDYNKLLKAIEKHFNMEKSPNFSSEITSPEFNYNSKLLYRDLEQQHILLGFKAPGFRDHKYYITQLLSIVLGGGMSSRLFQEIRENKALAYTISSFTNHYHDLGIFFISASTSKDKIESLINEIINVINTLDNLTEKELKRAKMQYNSALLFSYDNISSRANYMLNQYIRDGEITNIKNIQTLINSITKEDLIELAKEIFINKCSFAILGKDIPEKLYDNFQKILIN